MRIDDSFDAELTEAGVKQATDCGDRDDVKLRGWAIECVVSSPLTRCLHTGSLVFPDAMGNEGVPKLVFEDLREVNGWLVNAKRRRRSELEDKWTQYDFGTLTEEDELWQEEKLEDDESVVKRINSALKMISELPQKNIAVVAHGGLFRKMTDMVVTRGDISRFNNCELKTCKFDVDVDGQFVLEEIE
ncbi:hypothetical protein TL16_g11217 [Triparma laevis f. inornata]|uniref:Phosphoglycerate mutase n=2 Tax=Triparma laevis TaxID=1534972 RepID=A0A9W7ATB0_9STRA|nr:hypothetical protein TrLO_g12823 [Triparma laevis f. longispina]GMH88655.1 hypothetical protein TL16_g11217 [Triparma laevis f. inornata]